MAVMAVMALMALMALFPSFACAQKTAPPVLIFAENKRDVDAIHEFLLVKVGRGTA